MTDSAITGMFIFAGILGGMIWFFNRPGNFSFWQYANEIPEIFLDYAVGDDAWIVSDRKIAMPEEFVGPMKFVSKEGQVVNLYAHEDHIRESQDRFVEQYRDLVPERSFPWVSLLALVYPFGAMATFPPAPVMAVLGSGFANLGYLLLVALIPGRFRILGLTYRIQIVVAAVGSWLIGFGLTNVA